MPFFFRCLLVVLYFSGQACAEGDRQATRDGTAQSIQTLAQQTRQQVVLQAALEKIQADQAKVAVAALAARAARDSTIAPSL